MVQDFVKPPPRQKEHKVNFYRLCLDCDNGKKDVLSSRELCGQFMDVLVKVLEVKEIGRVVCEVGGPSWNGLPPGISIASLYVEFF